MAAFWLNFGLGGKSLGGKGLGGKGLGSKGLGGKGLAKITFRKNVKRVLKTRMTTISDPSTPCVPQSWVDWVMDDAITEVQIPGRPIGVTEERRGITCPRCSIVFYVAAKTASKNKGTACKAHLRDFCTASAVAGEAEPSAARPPSKRQRKTVDLHRKCQSDLEAAQAELASKDTRIATVEQEKGTIEQRLAALEVAMSQVQKHNETMLNFIIATTGRDCPLLPIAPEVIEAARRDREQLADATKNRDQLLTTLDDVRGKLAEKDAEIDRLKGLNSTTGRQLSDLRGKFKDECSKGVLAKEYWDLANRLYDEKATSIRFMKQLSLKTHPDKWSAEFKTCASAVQNIVAFLLKDLRRELDETSKASGA